MNDRLRFHGFLNRLFKPVLVADGFKVSGNVCRRIRGDVIHLLAFQGSVYGGKCAINLGIHLNFLPCVGNPQSTDQSKITEVDCEFRSRLAPDGESDKWWDYGASEAESLASVESMLQIYREVAVPYFSRFSSFPDDFVKATPAEFIAGAPSGLPEGYGSGRHALVMARIALHLGRGDEAKQYAEFGLCVAGNATGLRAAYRKIIESP